MRATALFFAYLLGAYTLAAVLCWPLGEWLTEYAGVPVHKFIGRGGLILALLGFWPLLKALRLADRRALGYGLPRGEFLQRLLQGFAAGLTILACLASALVLLGVRVIAEQPDHGLFSSLVQGVLGGFAVGFIEETFFRGALYTAIRRWGGRPASAILLPSLLYAALHFFTPRPFPPGTEVTLGSSLASLAGAFPDMFRVEHLDSFVALTLVGVFLALVRQRSGHLAWCIGLHAGWVLVIRMTRSYTDVDPAAPMAWLAGGYDGTIGWLAAAWIGLLALLVRNWPPGRQRPQAPGTSG